MDLQLRTKREGGFTLIELIAVIIILGILAAVIVPKYLDMTGAAKDGTYKGALSEGNARFNMAYSKYLMTNSAPPTQLSDLQTTAYLGGTGAISVGDFKIAYSGTNATITLTLQNAAGTAQNYNNGSAATLAVPWPN